MANAKDGYLADEKATAYMDQFYDPEARISEELFQRYSGKRAQWERNAVKSEKFRAGYQWTRSQIEELKRRKKAPIVVNLINPAVEQLKSLLTHNDPKFNAIPREGSDRKTATAFSDIMSHIWQYNRTSVKLKDTIDDYSVKGLGYMTAYWDPYDDFGKGEVIIEDIDPYNIYVDPLSKKRDFSDARHMMVVHEWTKEQIMATYRSIDENYFEDLAQHSPRQFEDDLPSDVDLEGDTDDSDTYRVIDRYSRRRLTMCHYRLGEFEYVIEKKYADEYKKGICFVVETQNLKDQSQTIDYMIEDDETSAMAQKIAKLGTTWHVMPQQNEQGEIVPVEVPGPPTSPQALAEINVERVYIHQLVDDEVMIETEYPGQYIWRVLSIGNKVYWKGYTDTTIYPIVCFPNRHKRNPYPHSDVMTTIDLQKELNVTRMHIMTHTANTAGLKVAVPRGSGKVDDLEDKLGQAGISVIEYNHEDGGEPHFMYPPQLPSQLYESEKRFEGTIYEQFGVYPFMGGGQGGGHSTSSGILIMDEMAQRRISSKRTDIEHSLNVLGKVVVQLVQRHYTEAKTIRLLQPSGRYNEVDLNSPVYDAYDGRLLHRINDVTIGAYDLIVASGSTLPSNRMIRMEYFMKLYAQNLIDQYEVLKNVDEVDAEGVMERMGVLSQLQGQVEALSEEVKRLEGDLQTADREAVGAKKRVEVEKFKAELARMKASIDTALNTGKERALSQMQQQTQQSSSGSSSEVGADENDEALITELNSLV